MSRWTIAEAQAGAAGGAVAGAVGAEQRLEQLREVVGVDARAVVEDLEEDVFASEAQTRSSTRDRAWRTALSSRLTSTRRSAAWSPSSAIGVVGATTTIARVDRVGRLARERDGVERARAAARAPAYSRRLNVNRSPTSRSSSVALSCARRSWSASPMPCSIASSEPRSVNSGVRRSCAIALTRKRRCCSAAALGERAAQPVGHPAAAPRRPRRPRACASWTGATSSSPPAIRSASAASRASGGDDPAPQQDDAGDERERERQQPGDRRRREAHGGAGALDEQRPRRPARCSTRGPAARRERALGRLALPPRASVVSVAGASTTAARAPPRRPRAACSASWPRLSGARSQLPGLRATAVARMGSPTSASTPSVGEPAAQLRCVAASCSAPAGLHDQRWAPSTRRVDVGALVRTDRPPASAPALIAGAATASANPSASHAPSGRRAGAAHRAPGGSKRYPTPQTVTSSCGSRGVGLELLAQLADVDRDRAAIAPRAPQQLEQLVAPEHLPRVLGEDPQQLELARGQAHAALAERDLVRRQVDRQPAEAQHARRAAVAARCPARAAQHRLDARDDLGRRRRLDDVVVGAEPEPAQLVAVVAARGEEQQRHVGLLADAPAQLEARGAGQHHVEQHAVDLLRLQSAAARRPRRRR